MCNGTWVCFPCRTAVRRPLWRTGAYVLPTPLGTTDPANVRCPHCGEPCTFLGHKIPIPRKHDVTAWRNLRDQITQLRVAVATQQFAVSVRCRHDLERRIRELENRPRNPGRDALLKQLREELAAGPSKSTPQTQSVDTP